MTRLQRRNYTRWLKMVKRLDMRQLCRILYKFFGKGRTPGVRKE